MPEYLASYTIYFAHSESDRRAIQSSFNLDPETFAEREKWELKRSFKHRFFAQNDKEALTLEKGFEPENFGGPNTFGLGRVLDELLKIKPVKIK